MTRTEKNRIVLLMEEIRFPTTWETLYLMGYTTYQLVQDFFRQQSVWIVFQVLILQ